MEDRPYQPLRATGHADADGLMSANGGPGSRSWLIRGLPSLELREEFETSAGHVWPLNVVDAKDLTNCLGELDGVGHILPRAVFVSFTPPRCRPGLTAASAAQHRRPDRHMHVTDHP